MKKLGQSRQREFEILGENYAGANKRLYRYFLFGLVQKLNKDICHRCNQKIDSVHELSIDHVKNWYKVDMNLFWDLENIVFAHTHCNCAAARQGKGKLKYFGISEEKSRFIQGKVVSYKPYCQTKEGQNKTLSTCKTQEEAAICRDLGTMYYQEGKGRLNFEQFRPEYKLKIQYYLDNKRELFYKNGPIKDLVYYFYKKL